MIVSKIALTADWHFRGKDLDAASRQLAALVAECNARNVDLVCVAGDIFDNSAIQDTKASTGAIVRAVKSCLYKIKADVLTIPGNHDMAGAGSVDALHALTALVIRSPQWYVVHHLNLAIFCVPWDWSGAPFPNKDEIFSDEYERVIARKCDRTLLLAHGEIIGTVMNGGMVCQANTGKFQVPRAALEAMPFDKKAFGHFHKRQDYFIGALRQDDFGHEGEPAGFEIWDTETGETNWIELDAAPRYKTFVLAPGDPSPPAPPEGWKYKVRLTGAQPNLVLAHELELDGHLVEVIPDFEQRIARANIPPNVICDPPALMALWTEANDLDGKRLDRMLEVWENLGGDENDTKEATA